MHNTGQCKQNIASITSCCAIEKPYKHTTTVSLQLPYECLSALVHELDDYLWLVELHKAQESMTSFLEDAARSSISDHKGTCSTLDIVNGCNTKDV